MIGSFVGPIEGPNPKGEQNAAEFSVREETSLTAGAKGRTSISTSMASSSAFERPEANTGIWRGTVRGRPRDLGLGTFPYVSLGEARDKALEYRRLAKAGEDPAAVHAPAGTAEVQRKSNAPTFRKAAAAVIDLHRPTWRNPKSAAQWEASLRDYAYPVLGDMRVDEIGAATSCAGAADLEREARDGPAGAATYFGSDESAIAAGHRPDNPAGDALTAALPKGGRKQRHQRALPHQEVGAALETVRRSNAQTSTKLAFEFLVLTAARSGEVRMMTWDEVHAGRALEGSRIAHEGGARASRGGRCAGRGGGAAGERARDSRRQGGAA